MRCDRGAEQSTKATPLDATPLMLCSMSGHQLHLSCTSGHQLHLRAQSSSEGAKQLIENRSVRDMVKDMVKDMAFISVDTRAMAIIRKKAST